MSRQIQVTAGVLLVALCFCAPAHGQEIDPALKADVEKLLDVTGAAQLGPKMASAVLEQIVASMRAEQPQVPIPEKLVQVVKATLDAEFARAFAADGAMHNDLVRSYATYFTREDVTVLLTFYGTDTGRKALAVMPQLSAEGTVSGQKWVAANMPRIMGLLRERLVAEGFLK